MILIAKQPNPPTEPCGVTVTGKRIGPKLPLESYTIVCTEPKGHHHIWHEGTLEGKPFRFAGPREPYSLKDANAYPAD